MFEIIFEGKLEPGFAEAQVRTNLTVLFKASADQVDKMFSGRPVVLRNRLDSDTARKYEAALRKNGAMVHVRPMEGSEVAAPAPTASAGVPSSNASTVSPAVSRPSDPGPSAGGLKLAGERADAILQNISWDVAPAGTPLDDQTGRPVATVDYSTDWGLAPAGSDLGQLKSDKKPVEPDISHLKLVRPSD